MNYAIIRTQKLKSKISVRRSLKHAFREQETPNANQDLTQKNTHIGAKSSQEAFENFNGMLPEKIRSNAVYCIEYLITASPEAMKNRTREQQDAYFKDAEKWLKKRHGENVFYMGIHRDETTPHMYAYAVPIDDKKRLNCRAFLGGSKALSEMQTSFYTEVGKIHALSRGVEGSKARHKDVKQYYARVNEKTPQLEAPEVPKPKFFEDKEKYGYRVANAIIEEVNHHLIPMQMKSKELEAAKARLKEMERTAREAQSREKALQMIYEKKLKEEREKNKKESEKSLEVIRGLSHSILQGGDALENVRKQLNELSKKENEKQVKKDKGMER